MNDIIQDMYNLFIAGIQLDAHGVCVRISQCLILTNKGILWVCDQLLRDVKRRIDGGNIR